MMKMTDILTMIKDAFEKRDITVKTESGKSDDGFTRVRVTPQNETEFILRFTEEVMKDIGVGQKLEEYIDEGIDIWQKRQKEPGQFLEITTDGPSIWQK